MGSYFKNIATGILILGIGSATALQAIEAGSPKNTRLCERVSSAVTQVNVGYLVMNWTEIEKNPLAHLRTALATLKRALPPTTSSDYRAAMILKGHALNLIGTMYFKMDIKQQRGDDWSEARKKTSEVLGDLIKSPNPILQKWAQQTGNITIDRHMFKPIALSDLDPKTGKESLSGDSSVTNGDNLFLETAVP